MGEVVQMTGRFYTAKRFTAQIGTVTWKFSGTLCGAVDMATDAGTFCLTPDEITLLIAALQSARDDVLKNSRPNSDPRIVEGAVFQRDRLTDLLPSADCEGVRYDPFSLTALIAWLEAKPARHRYSYCVSEGCLIAQFTGLNLHSGHIDIATFPGAHSVVLEFPHTFGAALKRARALQSSGGV